MGTLFSLQIEIHISLVSLRFEWQVENAERFSCQWRPAFLSHIRKLTFKRPERVAVSHSEFYNNQRGSINISQWVLQQPTSHSELYNNQRGSLNISQWVLQQPTSHSELYNNQRGSINISQWVLQQPTSHSELYNNQRGSLNISQWVLQQPTRIKKHLTVSFTTTNDDQ